MVAVFTSPVSRFPLVDPAPIHDPVTGQVFAEIEQELGFGIVPNLFVPWPSSQTCSGPPGTSFVPPCCGAHCHATSRKWWVSWYPRPTAASTP